MDRKRQKKKRATELRSFKQEKRKEMENELIGLQEENDWQSN